MDLIKSFIGPFITIVTSLLIIGSTYGGMKAEVNTHSEKLKSLVSKDEFNLVLDNQKQMLQVFEKRMDRIENKIDNLSK